MLKLLKGDDTAANNRTIFLEIVGDKDYEGYRIGFSFCGIEKSGDAEKGKTLSFDYSREETERLPFGIHYGSVWLEKDGLRQTFANNIQLKVTDCVEEVEMSMKTNGNKITVSVKVNTSVPHIDEGPLKPESTIGDVKKLANSIRAAINGEET